MPATTLSRIEFHPQCVTNSPTAGCFSTASCSHHGTTSPFSPTSTSAAMSGRRTHRYGEPHRASPDANSRSRVPPMLAWLPKLE
uniref:Uncharacterized protein n=1 Tax=Arundo donax TaxID=35708 RepID=A0A0A8ZJM0_ARUDO